jgi:hypothetical protein
VREADRTQSVGEVIDVAGQPVKRPASAVGGMNPFPISTAKNDPVLSELARLGVSTSQAPPSIKRRGKETILTDSQRQKLTEQEGQQLYRRLRRIVLGKGWQSMSDQAKRAKITKMRKEIEESRPQRIARMQ